MRSTCHLPDQKSVRSCLQVNPLLLRLFSMQGDSSAVACIELMFHPLTRNLHGLESHGSGVLFKPTRGPFVTSEFGTLMPVSIHKPLVRFVRSTPFSSLVIPIA